MEQNKKKKTTRHLTSRVFVLNADKTPLMPCNNARARKLNTNVMLVCKL